MRLNFKDLVFYLSITLFFSVGIYAVYMKYVYNPCEHMSIMRKADGIIINNWFINSKDIECIINLNPKRITISSSTGGQLLAAHELADLIRENKIQVNAFKECLSACTFLLAAASESKICPRTVIGIHHFGSNNTSYIDPRVYAYHLHKMKSYGINIAKYKNIIDNTPYSEMHYSLLAELSDMGFRVSYSKRCV